jgi:dephospho-CoA kinase
MLKIGLTGGIGSGKTTVSDIFRVIGIPVYYADAAARRIMREDHAIRARIIESFGPQSYLGDLPDRDWLSANVFRNRDATERMNAIVHPATISDARGWMGRQKGIYAIKEAALIFESGGERDLDLVIGVTAPPELRIQRVMHRDGLSRDAVLQRMARQMPEDDKMKRCQFVIINDDRTALIPQVLKIHRKLVGLADGQPEMA